MAKAVSIFIPCFIDQLFPETGFNMVKVLEKAGCVVHYNRKQTCCGQPAFNAGFLEDSRAVAQKFVRDFSKEECVVMPSASCAGFVKNYMPQLFENNSFLPVVDTLGKKIFEFSTFLTEELKVTQFGARFQAKATYHDSCAALRECGIKEGPRSLLKNVEGLEMVEMADNETCCGFGGTFAVKFEPISAAMADQKVNHALSTGADTIISTDWSCLMQLDGVIRAKQLPMRTMHIADVLAAGW